MLLGVRLLDPASLRVNNSALALLILHSGIEYWILNRRVEKDIHRFL